MRYKHIILLAMFLVSKVCCKGEYWWNETEKCFKSYGLALPGDFLSGNYSFRPIAETGNNEEPQIVIEFQLISRPSYTFPFYCLHDILVKNITLKTNELTADLKTQTRQMGKTMVALFVKGSGENIDDYRMLRMLYRFVFALNAIKSEFIETLAVEFAAGMTEAGKDPALIINPNGYHITDFPILSEEQAKLVVKLTQATADLVYDTTQLPQEATVHTKLQRFWLPLAEKIYSEHKEPLSECLYKKKGSEQFTLIDSSLKIEDCRLPFGEYFFNLFMGAVKIKDFVPKDDALANLYVMIKAASVCGKLPDHIHKMTECITEILHSYNIIKEDEQGPFSNLNLPHKSGNSLIGSIYNSVNEYVSSYANSIANYFSRSSN